TPSRSNKDGCNLDVTSANSRKEGDAFYTKCDRDRQDTRQNHHFNQLKLSFTENTISVLS
ncbi:hypothetical protein, partial [Vibrio parahaemolyticus]|uniref:hypothetical protein n=1 Tax=Vibrio parahaemolyticus TaxID=670 RepID=UPI001E370E60